MPSTIKPMPAAMFSFRTTPADPPRSESICEFRLAAAVCARVAVHGAKLSPSPAVRGCAPLGLMRNSPTGRLASRRADAMSLAEAHVEKREDVAAVMAEVGRAARAAMRAMSLASTAAKNGALMEGAAAIRRSAATILADNARDLAEARSGGATPAFLDRLALDARRVEAMAKGLEEVAALARSGRPRDRRLDAARTASTSRACGCRWA